MRSASTEPASRRRTTKNQIQKPTYAGAANYQYNRPVLILRIIFTVRGTEIRGQQVFLENTFNGDTGYVFRHSGRGTSKELLAEKPINQLVIYVRTFEEK